jgi:anti-sigma factor RsiW
MDPTHGSAQSESRVVKLSNEKIQDYLDGRLSERDRAVVAAYLLSNPQVAQEISRLQLLDDIVASLGQGILDERIPDRLLAPIREALEKDRSDRSGG